MLFKNSFVYSRDILILDPQLNAELNAEKEFHALCVDWSGVLSKIFHVKNRNNRILKSRPSYSKVHIKTINENISEKEK